MKPLGQYSDQEFIDLVHEAGQLSYLEKVKLGFEKFATVRGEESRVIDGKTYVFSLNPRDREENHCRWKFFFDWYVQSNFNLIIEDINEKIDAAIYKKETIEIFIEKHKAERRVGKMELGYRIFALGHDLLDINIFNLFMDLKIDHSDDIRFLGDGFVSGQVEKELEARLEQFDAPKGLNLDEPVEINELNTSQKIALLYELGILDNLLAHTKNGNKSNLSKLLIPLLGIRNNEKESFTATLGFTLNETSNKSSVNPTSIKKIKSLLIISGIDIPMKSDKKNNKK